MFQSSAARQTKTPFLTNVRFYRRPKRTVNKYVHVQLMQDIPGVGVRGEVKRVKPGFMKNFLHTDNKAVYVNDNLPPRIPVVKIRKEPKVEKVHRPITREEVEQALEEGKQTKTESTAMSLKELSQLFKSLKSETPRKKAFNVSSGDLKVQVPSLDIDSVKAPEKTPAREEAAGKEAETEAVTYEVVTLQEFSKDLPSVITISASTFPLAKSDITARFQELAGRESVNSIEVAYIDSPAVELKEVTEAGRYIVKLFSKDKRSRADAVVEVEGSSK
ncbi:hypothetical protein Cantr_02851 [Candida viswanathii]|uniref:Ribosomal protein L9 domain-containing protein n=1 Tax=Candida viswanathii TaxID=5486 RepID=A0A367YMP6_9ASCO|nr:hypothetical protein Cantr_02851 [Candida viswanathii]